MFSSNALEAGLASRTMVSRFFLMLFSKIGHFLSIFSTFSALTFFTTCLFKFRAGILIYGLSYSYNFLSARVVISIEVVSPLFCLLLLTTFFFFIICSNLSPWSYRCKKATQLSQSAKLLVRLSGILNEFLSLFLLYLTFLCPLLLPSDERMSIDPSKIEGRWMIFIFGEGSPGISRIFTGFSGSG